MANIYHPKAFISYSHDSFEHINRVLELSKRMRRDVVDCNMDQYEMSPPSGWARWTEEQIEKADYVTVICSKTYKNRWQDTEKTELPDELDLILATQQRTVEEHYSRFVGREYVKQAFDRFIARHSCGYFILRGGPGQGKTAMSSSLVKSYGCIYYFISRTGGR